MGTRGLMGVRVDGQDKLVYNHFDSYPTGLGEAILSDVKELGLDTLTTLARHLRIVDGHSTPTDDDKRQLAKYTDLSVSKQSTGDWYCLTRGLQGELKATLKAGVAVDGSDFINDSLFCAWAYVVNCDDGTLEVYEGFQKKPHSDGRYASRAKNKGGYYPCRLVVTYKLDDIPEDWASRLEEAP